MEIKSHIAALRREGALFAAVAERTDFAAPIPSCPEWTMRDLVRHICGVHRWAAASVARCLTVPPSPSEEGEFFDSAPADAGLIAWFRAGHAALVQALEQAPAGLACWSFLPAPSPLAFWARRQAHETAIHRADIECTTGGITPFPPDFAADGLDELLLGFVSRPGRLHAESAGAILLQAVDVERVWHVRMQPEGIEVRLEPSAADCSVRATASDLHLLLWNRRTYDGLEVQGDTSLLDLWRQMVRIRWS